MKANKIDTSNIQVCREEIREQAGQVPQVCYYLGWGKDNDILGDPMSIEELQALYAIIGRVIEQNTAIH